MIVLGACARHLDLRAQRGIAILGSLVARAIRLIPKDLRVSQAAALDLEPALAAAELPSAAPAALRP